MLYRTIGSCVLALAILYWLFADTYRRYSGRDDETAPIRFAHFGNYHDYRLWQTVISKFEQDHPTISVRQEYVVGLRDHYHVKLRQQALAKALPEVALIQLGPFQEMAHAFEDLSEFSQRHVDGDKSLEHTLHSTGLDAFRVEGQQRGLPISGGNLLIYCNRQCFERASRHHGIEISLPHDDWTMEDFMAIAKQLTIDFEDDGHVDQFGFWRPRWIYYLPFLWSFGATMTDAQLTTWQLTGPEAEQALTFYRQLALIDHVCPREEEVPQIFQDTGFLTGQVAMCINGPWFLPFLEQTSLADSYVVVPIPFGPGGRVTRMTWDGIVMAPNLLGDRRKQAEQLIRYLLSADVQQSIARSGKALPSRTDALPAFIYPPGNPSRTKFMAALDYSRLQPRFPRFGEWIVSSIATSSF